MKPKSRSSKNKTRVILQMFFFAFILSISINHVLEETGAGIPLFSAASLHTLCPFGGIVTTYQYATTGTFVQKIHESALILLSIVVLLAVGFGPLFCGWVCPLGSFQEWIGVIGKKLFKQKYNAFIPKKIDQYLRFLRYGVFAWVVYETAYIGKLVFTDVDPYYALFHFWTNEATLGGLMVLGIVILFSFFIERPWCKYACPLGAFLGITNLFRIFKIRRNEGSCIACRACDKVCPMNIEISNQNVIKDHQCISCMECTSENTCPIIDTVECSTKRGQFIETEIRLSEKGGK